MRNGVQVVQEQHGRRELILVDIRAGEQRLVALEAEIEQARAEADFEDDAFLPDAPDQESNRTANLHSLEVDAAALHDMLAKLEVDHKAARDLEEETLREALSSGLKKERDGEHAGVQAAEAEIALALVPFVKGVLDARQQADEAHTEVDTLVHHIGCSNEGKLASAQERQVRRYRRETYRTSDPAVVLGRAIMAVIERSRRANSGSQRLWTGGTMNMQEGLARFVDLWEHPERVSRPKPRSIDETLAERGDLTPEQLERGVELFEGEDRMPPEALQRFADLMD